MTDIVKGEHMPAEVYDPIPEGHMPVDVPYGAWCICSQCSTVGRSTYGFDFYGDVGALLKCETCAVNAAAPPPVTTVNPIDMGKYVGGQN